MAAGYETKHGTYGLTRGSASIIALDIGADGFHYDLHALIECKPVAIDIGEGRTGKIPLLIGPFTTLIEAESHVDMHVLNRALGVA